MLLFVLLLLLLLLLWLLLHVVTAAVVVVVVCRSCNKYSNHYNSQVCSNLKFCLSSCLAESQKSMKHPMNLAYISRMQQNVVIDRHDIGMIFAAPHLVQEDRALCEPHWVRVDVEHRNDSMVATTRCAGHETMYDVCKVKSKKIYAYLQQKCKEHTRTPLRHSVQDTKHVNSTLCFWFQRLAKTHWMTIALMLRGHSPLTKTCTPRSIPRGCGKLGLWWFLTGSGSKWNLCMNLIELLHTSSTWSEMV